MTPGTSEPLVPQGFPYGERQAQVEQMQLAGLPLAPRQGNAPVPSQVQAGGGPVSPAGGQGAPAGFDLFDELQPTQPWDYQPQDPNAHLRNLAQVSPNAFVRALLTRVLGEGP